MVGMEGVEPTKAKDRLFYRQVLQTDSSLIPDLILDDVFLYGNLRIAKCIS